jgi:hypothetical protein
MHLLEGLKNTTKNLSQSNRCSCRDSNRAIPACESIALPSTTLVCKYHNIESYGEKAPRILAVSRSEWKRHIPTAPSELQSGQFAELLWLAHAVDMASLHYETIKYRQVICNNGRYA